MSAKILFKEISGELVGGPQPISQLSPSYLCKNIVFGFISCLSLLWESFSGLHF